MVSLFYPYNLPKIPASPTALLIPAVNGSGPAGNCGATPPNPASPLNPAPNCCSLCCGSNAAVCAACLSACNCD